MGSCPRATLWLPLLGAAVLAAAPGPAVFPQARFPVQAVEQNVALLAPGHSMPRILTSDQWSDYLIYRLYPAQRVFFDGRSDFYGPALGSDYRALMAASRDWYPIFCRYRFDLALLPRDWPLNAVLDREPGWRKVYQDGLANLYEHERSPR